MNPYKEFEDYLNDGKVIEATIIDALFSCAKYMKLYHQHVEMLYKDYDYSKEVKYENICTYVLYNLETKEFYIGSGNRDIREYDHFRKLKVNEHGNYKLQNAFNKNKNFLFYYTLLKTRKDALALEQILIDYFWHMDGRLNLAKYVEIGMLGLEHTEGTKKKMSTSRLKYYEEHPEAKKIISDSSSGRVMSEESRNKSSKTMALYWENNPDFRKLATIASKNYWSIEENRLRQSEARINYFANGGVPYQLLKPFTDYHCKRISEGRLLYYKNLSLEDRLRNNKAIGDSQKEKVICDNIEYDSRLSASEMVKLTPPGVEWRMQSPYWPTWYRYKDMYSRPCNIKGKEYESVVKYSLEFNLNKEDILACIQSTKVNHYDYKWI